MCSRLSELLRRVLEENRDCVEYLKKQIKQVCGTGAPVIIIFLDNGDIVFGTYEHGDITCEMTCEEDREKTVTELTKALEKLIAKIRE